ncbi:uncharacterized protein LOC127702848 [Mytilus californianus]|uniref:uncharacterized protein LOC127702848 n=1 Tax=Mytilus californianus TaxID=6549 RepID=UPI0022453816|nr:uncharacterized protein LOC127702848 [Mytilus californianus]
MKIQFVVALLCLVIFLHSEGKHQDNGHYKTKAKGHNHENCKSKGDPPKKCEAPCKTLPTTCPVGYSKLTNQSISPNCYLFEGNNTSDRPTWYAALARCISTPGAYLWIPETIEEAEAIRDKFNIVEHGFDIYVGANNLVDSDTYVYSVTNDTFDWDNLAFGEQFGLLKTFDGCMELEFNQTGIPNFLWDSDTCSSGNEAYIFYPNAERFS